MADAPKKPPLTKAAGIPLSYNQNALTAGPRGPLLVQDWQLFEKHAHFNRERIPERVVHAKGSGAYGTFTVTGDITRYTKAGYSRRSASRLLWSSASAGWHDASCAASMSNSFRPAAG